MSPADPPHNRSRRPSIKDVAQEAGVSTATVSHVFSGKRRVNAGLAKRVRTAAEALGYTIDPVASQLRTGRARVVAVLVPDLEDLFLNRLVAQLESCAQDAGYEIIVSSSGNTPEIETRRLRALLAWRPAGVILVPCRDALPDTSLEMFEGTPLVAADRIHPSTASFDTVTLDNFGSGMKVAEHLITKGARSMLLIGADFTLHSIRERVRGVKDLAARHIGVAVEDLEIGVDPLRGVDRIVSFLRGHPQPDAVVGLTNVTTLAALSAFAELGIEAPRDLMLLGFHDSLWMTARKTPITTLAQPVDEVARCAWDRLTRRMTGDTSARQNIVLSSHLIERASTQTPPKV